MYNTQHGHSERERMIKDLLQKGKENRISFDELKELTGCSNERTLRKMIADERRQGVLICSGADGGYWLPESDKDIEEFIRFYKAEAATHWKTLKPFVAALKVPAGQPELEEVRT